MQVVILKCHSNKMICLLPTNIKIVNCWIFSILLVTLVKYGAPIRVCDTFDDYLDSTNKHCRNNSDAELNVTQILERWGCTVKEHYLTTEDGYEILVIQAFMDISKSTPIILAHGLLMNSLSFIGNYNKSSTYQLVTSGYEVFLMNFRVTRYSTRYMNYTDNDRSFWNFSLHEMAIYDLRSCVNLVYNRTNQKSIIIGFSMGSTLSLIYTSTYPTEAEERLKGLILMAPVRTFKYSRAIFTTLAPLWTTVRPLVDKLWNGQVLPRNEELNRFCSSGLGTMLLCATMLIPVIGDDYAQLDPLYLPVTNALIIDRTGIDIIGHYVQIILTGQFKRFDYGPRRNMELYGNFTPPTYDVSRNTIPAALFVGLNDWVASSKDAVALSDLLGRSLCGLTVINYPKWNHGDFLMSKDMNSYLNVPLMDKVVQIEDGRCS